MSKLADFKVPHTLVLLFGMVILAQLLTYVLQPGTYDREGRQVIAGSYHTLSEEDAPKVPIYTAFSAIPKGFEAAQDIIFFVFIVGGAFGVLRATGSVDAIINKLLELLGSQPQFLIAGGIAIFAFGSTTIGMAEEYIPFIPILLALCIGLGFDAVTAVGILCVGYGVGYGVAAFNPFQVIIAQQVAGLPPTSGSGFRLILTLIFAVIGIHHVWRYAQKVKKDPEASLVKDIEPDPNHKANAMIKLNGRHIAIIAFTLFVIVAIVVGIKMHHWYLVEMGAIFIFASVIFAVIGKLGVDDTAKAFCEGAAELTTTALLIGVARAIQIVLDDGMVVDTIIYNISQPLQTLGPSVAAIGMFVFQSFCNLFIPSGSGQAYVTMPVMAPLADLVGVTRQTAVLAFQFGDGFTNIIVPTNAVLVAILAIARVPYVTWIRFILPFMLKIWVVCIVALIIAVNMPFT